MRILCFILSFYFLGLSAKTCSDTAMDSHDCQIVACVHIENGGHADDHSADACSPLCTCACCGSVTLVAEFAHEFKANLTPLPEFLYSENKISEITYSIWQPPKI